MFQLKTIDHKNRNATCKQVLNRMTHAVHALVDQKCKISWRVQKRKTTKQAEGTVRNVWWERAPFNYEKMKQYQAKIVIDIVSRGIQFFSLRILAITFCVVLYVFLTSQVLASYLGIHFLFWPYIQLEVKLMIRLSHTRVMM